MKLLIVLNNNHGLGWGMNNTKAGTNSLGKYQRLMPWPQSRKKINLSKMPPHGKNNTSDDLHVDH